MAIFQGRPEDAVTAALEMQTEIHHMNKNRAIPLKIGIGIHTGPLIMGIIGDHERTDAATISDTVNTASRMEGLTKEFQADILLSEETYSQITDRETYDIAFLGDSSVKGKSKPIGVYSCKSMASEKK